MKRILFILSCVVAIVLVYAGFTYEDFRSASAPGKRNCTGYEIIEAGKGIDCHGDTILLTKRSGFYEVAANYPAN
jgi:hypothetical protein